MKGLFIFAFVLPYLITTAIVGNFYQLPIDKNETMINKTKDQAEKDIVSVSGYSKSSYNFYPLALFDQVVNGINYKVYYALQKKGSTSADIIENNYHFANNQYNLIKTETLDTSSNAKTIKKDEMVQERMRNALSKYFFNSKEKVSDISINDIYENVLNHISFYTVQAKVGKNKRSVNVVVMEKEDKSFEVVAVFKEK